MSTVENVELTKEYITSALFTLMEQKPYEEITISEITTKAGVSRGTYYRHFNKKDDIIVDYFQRETVRFHMISAVKLRTWDDFYELVFNAFSRLKEKAEIIRAILKAHLEFLYLDYLNSAMRDFIAGSQYEVSEYTVFCLTGGFFNVSVQWVKNGCRESVRVLTEECMELCLSLSNLTE